MQEIILNTENLAVKAVQVNDLLLAQESDANMTENSAKYRAIGVVLGDFLARQLLFKFIMC